MRIAFIYLRVQGGEESQSGLNEYHLLELGQKCRSFNILVDFPLFLYSALPPYGWMNLSCVLDWVVARQLPDVAEVEVVVVAGQLTEAAHQLVRLGQVVVKSHAPVSSVQRPHQAEVLLDSFEIFLRLVSVGGSVPIEREPSHLLV